jgi:hypothetical protein
MTRRLRAARPASGSSRDLSPGRSEPDVAPEFDLDPDHRSLDNDGRRRQRHRGLSGWSLAQLHFVEDRFRPRLGREVLPPLEQKPDPDPVHLRNPRDRCSRLAGLFDDPPLVCRAEVPPAAGISRSSGWDIGRSPIAAHRLKHRLRPTATPIQQFASQPWNLNPKRCTPVPEPLQRKPIHLAILPLIQRTLAPALDMRSPERLQLIALHLANPRHLHLHHHGPRRERKIGTLRPTPSVRSLYAYGKPCSRGKLP